MKNNILTIIKKEFSRFFGDPRMAITTILLPGLLIYVLYSFMGSGMMSSFEGDEDYRPKVAVCQASPSMEPILKAMDFEVTEITEDQIAQEKTKIQDKEGDLLLVFPKDFDQAVEAYDSQSAQAQAPEIQVYYNSAETESSSAYQMVIEALSQYESSLANKFDVNRGGEGFDMATDKDVTGKVFSMMVPMLLMIFIFSGCMSIAPEAIAGEKERGTIATLLVTPMKRRELAVGKIISLSVIALLSGLSSLLGTMLSMPKLMGAAADSMNISVYQPGDYVLLLFVVISTVLIIIALISIISAYSRSVKEAGTAIMPLMILVMLISVTSMMGSGPAREVYWYFIPLYNSVQCMNGIFSFSYDMTNMVVTIVSNFLYAGLLAAFLTRLFNSEKVMFSR